ncbi:MAG: hypothetical protein ACI959_000807, partial [Limisphaerales bacterium]
LSNNVFEPIREDEIVAAAAPVPAPITMTSY